MSDSTNKTTTKNKILHVLAYPAAAISGLFFARTSVQSSAYDNALFHGALDDLREPLKQKAREAGRQAIAHAQRGEHFDIAEHTKFFHNRYTADVEKRMEMNQLGTLRKKWKFILPHQKQSAIVHGFTAAGITLGAIFALSNLKIFERLFDSENKSATDASETQR